jgi:hypothetical protein
MLVLTFDRSVLADTSTTLAAGVGSVSSTTFSGNTATVQLSGVSDRQTITVELDNVVGVVGVNSKVLVSMSVLICDVNQSGSVTNEDILAVQSHSGATVDSTTFKYDTTANGVINSSDISYTQSSESDSLYPDLASPATIVTRAANPHAAMKIESGWVNLNYGFPPLSP